MSRILICPAACADAVIAEEHPSHVIGLSAPVAGPSTPSVPANRLDLAFHDIAVPQPGLTAPSGTDIAALLAFGETWDGEAPLLVHCQMGISRSTAAALILATAARPHFDEQALALALRAAHPCATPNPLMIALADDLLGRSGRLVAAVRSIGRGADYRPYRVVSLDLAAMA